MIWQEQLSSHSSKKPLALSKGVNNAVLMWHSTKWMAKHRGFVNAGGWIFVIFSKHAPKENILKPLH